MATSYEIYNLKSLYNLIFDDEVLSFTVQDMINKGNPPTVKPLTYDEIIDIGEMITDCESRFICWDEYPDFQKRIEEIREKVYKKEEQFLEEIYDVIQCGDGWATDDLFMIRDVFAPEVKFTLKLVFERS